MSCNSCSNSSTSSNSNCNSNCNTNKNGVCKDFRYNKTILALEKRRNVLLHKLTGSKSHDDYSYYVKEREFRKDIKLLKRRLEYIDRGEKFFINTTSCTVSADDLKIYADSLNYSITAPANVPKTTAFDVSVSLLQ